MDFIYLVSADLLGIGTVFCIQIPIDFVDVYRVFGSRSLLRAVAILT